MDVLALLKNDHRTVDGLFKLALQCEPDDDRLYDLADQIEKALTVHATIEEKFFYPLLKKRSEEVEDTVDVYEAFTEHDLLKRLIALLQSGRQPDEQFKAEVQVLSENVRHHVKEEESTIFSLAKQLLTQEELDDLGEKMEKAKARLLAQEPGSQSSASARKASANGRKASARKAAR